MSRRRKWEPPPGSRRMTPADIEWMLGYPPGTLDAKRIDEITYKESPFIKLLGRQQKQAVSSGANLCPPEHGPYKWVARDGVMALVDAKGRPWAWASKHDYEALKAEALRVKP